MSKQEPLNIHNLMLLDSQKKIKDIVKKGVIIHVGDEYFAQATQILDRNEVQFGNVRDKDSKINAIIIQ